MAHNKLSGAVAVYFRLLQWDRAWTAIAGVPELTRDDVDVLASRFVMNFVIEPSWNETATRQRSKPGVEEEAWTS